MSSPSPNKKKKWRVIKIVVISVIAVLSLIGLYIYNNFNKLLGEALLRSFNNSIVSDVYELKFEKLRVNLLEGSIRVFNVVIEPRKQPLKEYPYINSSFNLSTERLTLINVDIALLLQSSVLKLDRISITKPDIELELFTAKPILFPFKDTTSVETPDAPRKKAIEGFVLSKFQLIDASIHTTNENKQREFVVSNFNITLDSLHINQQPGEDQIGFQSVDISIGEFLGELNKGGFQRIAFTDFKIGFDSLEVQRTVDTLTFQFHDFGVAINNIDVQTADSIFHLSLKEFNLSYKDKSIKLAGLSYTPNISDAAIQKKYKYKHTNLSATVGSINISNVKFDSLIYYRNIFIDKITIDKPEIALFKDHLKPMDSTRFPKFLGQMIKGIPIPLLVKQVSLTNVNLVNKERKTDSTYASVAIRRGTVDVRNVTNHSTKQRLTINATAYIDDKVKFNALLGFDYNKPEFNVRAKFETFELPKLNSLIKAYTPASITKGVADEISFSTVVNWTEANGTMKFLYHDLEVDLALKHQAKWKSSVLAFAANSVLNESNPASTDMPPRLVQFHVKRDMNKGFVNAIIKSALSGLKETMIMSKENRKTHQASKKKLKDEKKKNK